MSQAFLPGLRAWVEVGGIAPLSVFQSVSAATDLDLISYLKAIPDARMRRGVRIPAWYLLLVAVLGILSKCESLRDLEQQRPSMGCTSGGQPRRSGG